MPQSTFLADATQFIDGVNPTFAPAGIWNLGVAYLGGSKSFVRRSLGSFNVFGAASPGRPLASSDTVTAAELVLQTASLIGPSGWPASIERITRADWDYGSSDWTHYKTGALWTVAGGDVATPPSPVGLLSPAGGEQVIAGMLAFVTDAIANRGGRVIIRIKADDEAPSQSQWCAYDASLSSPTRPRLRVTYTAADPTPIAHPTPPTIRGASAARPADANSATAPSRPSRASPP